MTKNLKSKTKDNFLTILFCDKNQVEHKISWGLGGGLLSIHLRFVCQKFSLPDLKLSIKILNERNSFIFTGKYEV